MTFGGIITAALTPFTDEGGVDEQGFRDLLRHLAASGSDGVVVAGTTGEGSTLADHEKERLFEIAVAEKGDLTIIAGTGSNDTAHTVHLTERAGEIGCDGALAVTPYYNKPNPAGIRAHYAAVAAVGIPVVLYNIPSRCVIDIPNELLRELGQMENIVAVKQARYEHIEPIDGLDLLAGNDDVLAEVLDAGGTGGITVASHIVGEEMRQMIDAPDTRRGIHESLRPVFDALAVTVNPIPVKTAMRLLGHRVGGFRLPLVEADESQTAAIRGALEARGLLASA